MVKVKICGITNLADAKAAVAAGADALGFVFYKKSPRYIIPEKARRIIKSLPSRIVKVGVFVNAKRKEILKTARSCGLDTLQFHGAESPAFCLGFKDYKTIKAFRVKDRLVLKNILKYKTSAYLFDTFVRSKPGGTGEKFDWRLLKIPGNIKQQVFLAGGLRQGNIKEAMGRLSPDWLDVSSSVEKEPGKKDRGKMKKLILAVRAIDRNKGRNI